MNTKRSFLVALFCLSTLTLSGCVFHHHHCRCSAPDAAAAAEKPCAQGEDGVKAGGEKPGAVKSPAAASSVVPDK